MIEHVTVRVGTRGEPNWPAVVTEAAKQARGDGWRIGEELKNYRAAERSLSPDYNLARVVFAIRGRSADAVRTFRVTLNASVTVTVDARDEDEAAELAEQELDPGDAYWDVDFVESAA